MAKTTTSVVQLKSRLSEYLRRVKAGGELVITERGVPVARLMPLDARNGCRPRPKARTPEYSTRF